MTNKQKIWEILWFPYATWQRQRWEGKWCSFAFCILNVSSWELLSHGKQKQIQNKTLEHVLGWPKDAQRWENSARALAGRTCPKQWFHLAAFLQTKEVIPWEIKTCLLEASDSSYQQLLTFSHNDNPQKISRDPNEEWKTKLNIDKHIKIKPKDILVLMIL